MDMKSSRAIAAVLLASSGFVVGATVFAIVLTKILVDAGLPGVRPSDKAVLEDLIPLLPLIGAFAVVNIIAAVGLLLERAWASSLAIATSLVAVSVGVIGLVLIAIGSDPLASTASGHSSADGFGIVGLFTVLYLAIIGAVAIPGWSQRGSAGAAA